MVLKEEWRMVSRQGGLSTGLQRVGNSHDIQKKKKKEEARNREGRTSLKSWIFQFHTALWLHEKVWGKFFTADKSSDNYARPHHPCASWRRGRVWEGWWGVAQKELVGNWSLTYCQPHRVTSGQSNSVICRCTFLISKPLLKSTHKTSPYTNTKHAYPRHFTDHCQQEREMDAWVKEERSENILRAEAAAWWLTV